MTHPGANPAAQGTDSLAAPNAEPSAARDLLEALRTIRELTRPGQEMGISAAVDLICVVWTTARDAIAKAEGQ